MTPRSIPATLAILFVLVGAGQFAGSVTSWAQALDTDKRQMRPRAGVTADGIVTRTDDSKPGTGATDDPAAAAARIEMRQATEEMKRERARMEAAKARLAEERNANRSRLAGLYARMPANKAASLLAALDPADAAAFIAAMPPESAAELVAALPEPSAIAVTQHLLTTDTE